MKNNDDHDAFAKTGDYDTVENVSGAPWPGAERTLRGRTITPPPPGRALPHRRPTMIDARSGETLGDLTERAAARAAPRVALQEMIDRAHPTGREMLRHLFGLNLDRAGPGTADAEHTGYTKDRPGTRTD